MSMTFTKLFSSITESTIWVAPDAHRICWITMLAMSDHLGRVWGSVPGLANRARLSVEDTRAALKAFMEPDPDSRTKDHEGRRIVEMDGGWRLLNHAKYRAIRDEEAIRESKRKYINTRRAIERGDDVENVELGRTLANGVDRSRANAEAEADTEEEQIHAASPPPARPPKASKPAPVPFNGLNAELIDQRACVILSADFDLPDEWGMGAIALGWTKAGALKEAERFRQYWTVGKGAGTRRTIRSWRTTWTNWLGKSERMNGVAA